MKFNLYKDAKGEWRWSMIARNGRIVAEGGEGYKHAHDLVKVVRKYIAYTVAQQQALIDACTRAGLSPTGRILQSRKK